MSADPLLAGESSFAILGIAPTLEAARVRAAYFKLLPGVQPHVDPTGFNRLRSAYEALRVPGGLAEAYFRQHLDIAAVAREVCEPLDSQLAAAQTRILAVQIRAEAAAAFFDRWSRIPWEDLTATQ